ncbi:hypothetical protein E1189_02600 [Sansalvadorimonas verongulae]|nr:hypothetical protein [Sansalvadorimonas verongulae]
MSYTFTNRKVRENQVMQSNIQTISINGTRWGVPDTVTECPICQDNAASVIICKRGHKICVPCFDSQFDRLENCLVCRKELGDRKTAQFTREGGLLTLRNAHFNCMNKGCGWSGGYHELDKHNLFCSKKPVDCDYGCGTSVPKSELETHKQQCRKRPYREGNLAADYETVMEARQLKTECLEAAGHQLTAKSKQELADRLIRLYPLVHYAALKEVSEANQAMSAGTIKRNPLFSHQCGFITSDPEEFFSHFFDCANKPLSCRHCTSLVPRRDLFDHEAKCEQRPLNCLYCDSFVPQESMMQHFLDCYPVDCESCNNDPNRSELLAPFTTVTRGP